MSYSQLEAGEDQKTFLGMAKEAEAAGDPIVAGLMRVEAANCLDRVGMKKMHCINLGPHSSVNPAHCIHCGKSRGKWGESEECIPRSALIRFVRRLFS